MKTIIALAIFMLSFSVFSQYSKKIEFMKQVYDDESYIESREDCDRIVYDGAIIYECESGYYTIDDSFGIKVVSYVDIYNKHEFNRMKEFESNNSDGFVIICSKNHKVGLMAISIGKKE